jgi:hypothetical protein
MIDETNLSNVGHWATRSSASPEMVASFQSHLPIHLIATPRHTLHTCHKTERLAEVMARNTERFDYFPVTGETMDDRQQIIGLLELVPYFEGKPAEGLVQDLMRPLSEDNLIGADAGILAFVRDADRTPCRLVMAASHISGLVSLSDLQRLPVRAALFALITHAEMTMADAIRREFSSSDGWKARLSDGRRQNVDEKRKASTTGNNFVDELLFTQLIDKVIIILKSPHFNADKSVFEHDLRAVNRLRDNLAHANEYAATRDAAALVCCTVRVAERWIGWLNNWLKDETSSEEP